MKVYQAEADADVLIVSTDTDLLVMLIGHARSTNIVYMPHRSRGKLQQNCTTSTKCNNSLDMLSVITCSLCMK